MQGQARWVCRVLCASACCWRASAGGRPRMRVRSVIPASTCIQELLDFLRGRDNEEKDEDDEEEEGRRVMGPLLWSVGFEPHRRRLLRALKVSSMSPRHNITICVDPLSCWSDRRCGLSWSPLIPCNPHKPGYWRARGPSGVLSLGPEQGERRAGRVPARSGRNGC